MKRLIALFLAFVMLFASAPAVFAADKFTDVNSSDWFYAPVNWAVQNGITTGIGDGQFGPYDDCTRGQVVTFLWAAAGRPEPTATRTPFVDVNEDDWFYKSVLWAVENGITGGTTAISFSPYDICTRGQVATFLWAAAGKPNVKMNVNPFDDVAEDAWYLQPVLWHHQRYWR